MAQLLPFPLVLLLFFSVCTNAWYIDEDCQAEKRVFVEQALTHAFQLNNYAMASLDSPSPEQTQVIEWLFGTDAGTRERLSRM